MTFQEAKSIARHLGLTLRLLRSGKYRVNFRDGNEAMAYYTDNLANVWRRVTSPRTVTWDKSLMRFKSWLIAINTGARDNADACALAPL
jgi:hypothetical protein